MKEQKILIAESGSGFGGSAKYLVNLVPFLKVRQFSVLVAAYGDGPFIQKIKEQQIPVWFVPSWRFPWKGQVGMGLLQIPVLFFQIVLRLKQNGIRIVHLNNEIFSHIPLLIAAKCAGAKVICHLHGWRALTKLEKACVPLVSRFICISEAGSRFYETQIGKGKIKAVPNGLSVNGELNQIDVKRKKKRSELGFSDQAFVISLFGRIMPWKGQDVFLKAFAEISREFPDSYALIAGHDDSPGQSFQKKLVTMAEDLGISDRVYFLSWQEDVWPLYAASDLVIHASTKPEPFGLVILEAMYADKPVIATRGGGADDILIHGETGLSVEAGQPEELAAAIKKLMTDKQLSMTLILNAKKRAQSLFTMERNALQLSEIYGEFLKN